MASGYHIESVSQPLPDEDMTRIAELFLDGFDGHPFGGLYIQDWTLAGASAASKGWVNGAIETGNLWLARAGDGGEKDGRILGALLAPCRGPNTPAAAAAADATVSEGGTATAQKEEPPSSAEPKDEEKEEEKEGKETKSEEDAPKDLRKEFMTTTMQPWVKNIQDKAWGNPVRPCMLISGIMVDKTTRGMGIGKALMQCAVEEGKVRGLPLVLMVQVENTMDWYRSLGFVVTVEDHINLQGFGREGMQDVTCWAMERS